MNTDTLKRLKEVTEGHQALIKRWQTFCADLIADDPESFNGTTGFPHEGFEDEMIVLLGTALRTLLDITVECTGHVEGFEEIWGDIDEVHDTVIAEILVGDMI